MALCVLVVAPAAGAEANGTAGSASRLPADVMHGHGLDTAAAWCHVGSTIVQGALIVQSHKLHESIGSNTAADHERPR